MISRDYNKNKWALLPFMIEDKEFSKNQLIISFEYNLNNLKMA